MVPLTDQLLVTHFLEGNKNAFRLLTERYQQKVFTICMGFTHDPDDASDVSQEVFIEVFRSLPKFRGQSTFSTWLYRITVTKSLKHIQRERFNKFKISLDFMQEKENWNLATSNHSTDENIIRLERKKLLKKAISSLAKKQRVAFVLSKYKELTNKEISEIMVIPIATVDTLIYRARSNMKKYIIKHSRNDEM